MSEHIERNVTLGEPTEFPPLAGEIVNDITVKTDEELQNVYNQYSDFLNHDLQPHARQAAEGILNLIITEIQYREGAFDLDDELADLFSDQDER